MFSALAEGHGDLKNQINLFVALAPTVYMTNVDDKFLGLLRDTAEILYDSFSMVNVYEVFGHKWRDTATIVCAFFKHFCDKESMNGIPITPYVNEYRARVKNSREQPGASVKALLHFAELMTHD
jgi:hypothetical protein